MTKEEIAKRVELEIEYHMSEFDLEREDVLDVVITNNVLNYMDDKITRDDLIACADYLGYELNMEVVDAKKEERRIRKEKRKANKASRKGK